MNVGRPSLAVQEQVESVALQDGQGSPSYVEPAANFARITTMRCNLRTLFAVQLLVCCLLAWWQMPFTVEYRRSDGTARRTVVKRAWNGRLHRWGSQADFYRHGQKAWEDFSYGGRYKAHCVNMLKGRALLE
jgi:hypothetical protein